ncbi:jg1930 [Pararge aegeria aegeria]|uniref:Jg1930 protein n=1 Tax=Pararge aegeria aegeria TaxID=348720 RepID=A0A8S4R3H4_9NEOP|nr:jg1930 [Pararge aegeria aegeria]
MGRTAPSRMTTNALEGRREKGGRFELDPHSSMSREVEDIDRGLYQFGRKWLKKKKKKTSYWLLYPFVQSSLCH